MRYINYNREERDLCAHLFRLLLEDQPQWGPLSDFIGEEVGGNLQIYSEVALIRDAYFARKRNDDELRAFMDQLVQLIALQNKIKDHTPFSKLSEDLNNSGNTNPKQIRYKMKEKGIVSKSDEIVYGSLQAIFNAKPDLAIFTNSKLFVYEAKYTLEFNESQMKRTNEIAELWSQLLFKDLGFDKSPEFEVRKLGLEKFNPDVSWKAVYQIAKKYWSDSDFSMKVLSKAI